MGSRGSRQVEVLTRMSTRISNSKQTPTMLPVAWHAQRSPVGRAPKGCVVYRFERLALHEVGKQLRERYRAVVGVKSPSCATKNTGEQVSLEYRRAPLFVRGRHPHRCGKRGDTAFPSRMSIPRVVHAVELSGVGYAALPQHLGPRRPAGFCARFWRPLVSYLGARTATPLPLLERIKSLAARCAAVSAVSVYTGIFMISECGDARTRAATGRVEPVPAFLMRREVLRVEREPFPTGFTHLFHGYYGITLKSLTAQTGTKQDGA